MSSIAIDMEVRSYMQAVAAELADLPDEERADLMADLESHLHEVASDGEGTLFERLGAASAYAAELRASAGLAPKGTGVAVRPRKRRIASSWNRLKAWYASTSQRTRRILAIGGVAAIAFVAYNIGDGGMEYAPYEETAYMVPELHHEDGTPISNICAYDSKMRPLKRVLLFDQEGRPIDNISAPGFREGTRVYGPDSGVLRNAYPLKQQIDGPEVGDLKAFKCPTLKD